MSLFTLESLPYQTHAVEAVVRVFEGTQKGSADQVGNRCALTWEDLKENIQRMANANGIFDDRVHLTAPEPGQPLDVCVEMETGTGKTLVYLRTLYALHQRYGWNKFIIVVPSLAIRAGVMSTLSDFGLQLAQQHGLNHAIPYFEYDSSKLHQLKSFIDSPTATIMVMNSQAFVGKGKVISNDQNEAPLDGMTWLQALACCRPVVVMDEPQMGMDTKTALEAFADMKPLAKLRYSATHQKDAMRNCVYRLTPAQAYEQGLVKKLEVMTVDEQHAEGTVQLGLSDTQVGKGQLPKCKLKLWHQSAKGEQTYKVSKWLGVGADLAEETQNRTYAGWRIEHIHKSLETHKWEVQFDNGQTLVEGQDMGHDQEGIFRLQLRWLIHRHFEKKAILAKQNIKCLSLIFIDRVANYLPMTPTETPLIKRLFEEEYTAKIKAMQGATPNAEQIRRVQASYFARTGKGEYTDNETSMAKNQAIFKDIVNDKAALVQMDNPVEFIFSHSALGVGWDNPNVFNIATLRHSRKEEKKRQELGRGLRICVNQQGQRMYDPPDTPLGQEVNLLTVVPNQSYQAYAQSYQQEIEEAYGKDGQPTPKPRHNRAGILQKKTLKLRDDMVHSEAFQAFWKTLARTTKYMVEFDEDAIVEEVAPKIKEIFVPPYSAQVNASLLRILEDEKAENPSVQIQYIGSTQSQLKPRFAPQDWIEAIGQDSRLSQKAVFRVLKAALEDEHCAQQFLNNPVVFAQQASAIIRRAERDHMLRGLRYEETGETLPLGMLKDVVETVKDIAQTPKRGIYQQQAIDSDFEKNFAEQADGDPQLMCVLKLPDGYVVPTPAGNYNPDFGLVFKPSGTQSMDLTAHAAQQPVDAEFFVVEVKGTHDLADPKALSPDEVLRIECAARHFQALGFQTEVIGRVVHFSPRRMFAAPRDTYEYFKQTDVNTGALA